MLIGIYSEGKNKHDYRPAIVICNDMFSIHVSPFRRIGKIFNFSKTGINKNVVNRLQKICTQENVFFLI